MSYTIKCDDGDLFQDSTGKYQVAYGREKCAQDIAESLLNNYDDSEDSLWLWYNGSTLYQIDHDPAFIDAIGAEAFISSSVSDAVNRLISLQEQDNYVDSTEKIYRIKDLSVNRVGYMTYTFFLQVVTESDDPVTVDDFEITLAQQIPASLSRGFDIFAPAGQYDGSKPFA